MLDEVCAGSHVGLIGWRIGFLSQECQKDMCLGGVCISDPLFACRECDGVLLVVHDEIAPSLDRAGLRV